MSLASRELPRTVEVANEHSEQSMDQLNEQLTQYKEQLDDLLDQLDAKGLSDEDKQEIQDEVKLIMQKIQETEGKVTSTENAVKEKGGKSPENVHRLDEIAYQMLDGLEDLSAEDAETALLLSEKLRQKVQKPLMNPDFVPGKSQAFDQREIRKILEIEKKTKEIFGKKKIFSDNYLGDVASRLEKATDEEKRSAKSSAKEIYRQYAQATPDQYKAVLEKTLNIKLPEDISNESVADYFEKAAQKARGVVELVYGLNKKAE